MSVSKNLTKNIECFVFYWFLPGKLYWVVKDRLHMQLYILLYTVIVIGNFEKCMTNTLFPTCRSSFVFKHMIYPNLNHQAHMTKCPKGICTNVKSFQYKDVDLRLNWLLCLFSRTCYQCTRKSEPKCQLRALGIWKQISLVNFSL